VPDWCEGLLLPGLGGETRDGRSIYALEAKANPKHAPLNTATVALIKDGYKLIHYRGYKGHEDAYELYDLANDPEEMDDLYPSAPAVAAEMEGELLARLEEANRTEGRHGSGQEAG
jgi:arylsulfatase A-like enzyme